MVRERPGVQFSPLAPKLNMYTVYILKDKNGKIYKGLTNNLERRLKEHRSGHTITTRKLTEIRVVYEEQFADLETARKRELYLKSAAGRRFLKNLPK